MDIALGRIVITGGGSGIGLATAKLAVARGASVVLLGRNETKLADAIKHLGPVATYRVVDVTNGTAVTEAFEAIGRFDHLVTCAAGITIGLFAEMPERAVREFFEAKFWGQYRAVRAALPRIAEHGSITLVSGFLGRKPQAGYSAFTAVNGAVEALARILAIELAPRRVNAIAPGQIDTLEAVIGLEANKSRKEACTSLPIGRIGTPEEVAHAVLYLAENGFTTGMTLDVDGGQ